MRKLPLALALLALATSPALAQSLYVVPDVPTDLGGTTYLPSHLVRFTAPAYSLSLALPPPATVDALQRFSGGDWLVSVEAPTDLAGTTFLPNDVIRTNGLGFVGFFCGNLVGVPSGSNVDAVILDTAGNLVLSFDVPTSVGALTVDAADLVRFTRIGPNCGDWAVGGVVFDGSATAPPVPAADNVTAADFWAPGTILSFDVPTDLTGTHLPGNLVSYNGAIFAPYLNLPGWPVSSFVDALSFLAAPGTVPVTMLVERLVLDGSILRLTWSAGCSVGDEDYGIYEGKLGTWYSHNRIDCFDDFSDLTEDIGTSSGNRYYLVVSKNTNDEGSYGKDSAGAERPVGGARCVATQSIACP